MARTAASLLSLLASVALAAAATAPIDCTFAASYPRQYVAYKTASALSRVQGRALLASL